MKKELKIFDDPKNVRMLLLGFYAVLIVLFVIDFFIPKHPEFAWEGFPNFFAVYGLVSYVLLIYLAKLLRRFIKRDEDYYNKD